MPPPSAVSAGSGPSWEHTRAGGSPEEGGCRGLWVLHAGQGTPGHRAVLGSGKSRLCPWSLHDDTAPTAGG